MQNLARNASTVWFKVYQGQTEIIDSYGNKTGSFAPVYGDLQSAQLMVAPSKGDAAQEVFGTLLDYDRSMTTAETTCPIDEQTVLWLDGVSTDQPYTHYVRKRAPWKNSVVYAVKQVEVANAPASENQAQY